MDKWLNNTNVLKIISLIFGVSLWFVVTMSPADSIVPTRPADTQYTYETQLAAIYDDNQYYIDLKSDLVIVTVKGSPAVVESVRSGTSTTDSRVYVDLTDYQPGNHDVDILTSGFPKGATVKVKPKTVQVGIESRQSKEIAITVERLGSLAENVVVGAMTLSAERAHVTGTAATVDKVAYVKAYLNVDGAVESVSQDVKLQALDQNGNFINVEINPQRIRVDLAMELIKDDNEETPGNGEDLENGEEPVDPEGPVTPEDQEDPLAPEAPTN